MTVQGCEAVNKAGKLASSHETDDLELMKIVLELTEEEKMIMWSQGYIDTVIDKMPEFGRDILEKRKSKWEDTKAFVLNQVTHIINQEAFIEKMQANRKEFALYVMEHYPRYQSLLFRYYDGKLEEEDFKTFVYRNRYTKHYLH